MTARTLALALGVLATALCLGLPDPAEAQIRSGSRGVRPGVRPLSGVALGSQGAIQLRHRTRTPTLVRPRHGLRATRAPARFYSPPDFRLALRSGSGSPPLGLRRHFPAPLRRGAVHIHGPHCPPVRPSHHGHGRPYRSTCEPCGRAYRSEEALHQHLDRVHRVPRWQLPVVLIQGAFGWSYRG